MKRKFDFEIYKLLYWIFIRKGREYIISILKNEVKKLGKKETILTINQVQTMVSNWSKIPVYKINEKTRKREILNLRQITMFLCKHKTGESFAEIGFWCGNKDHSTVYHSCKVVSNLLSIDKTYQAKYLDFINSVLNE